MRHGPLRLPRRRLVGLMVVLALLSVGAAGCDEEEAAREAPTTTAPTTTAPTTTAPTTTAPTSTAPTTTAPTPTSAESDDTFIEQAIGAARDDMNEDRRDEYRFEAVRDDQATICVDRIPLEPEQFRRPHHVLVSLPSLEVRQGILGSCERRAANAERIGEAAHEYYNQMDDYAVYLQDLLRDAMDERPGSIARLRSLRDEIEAYFSRFLVTYGGDSEGGHLLLGAAYEAHHGARTNDLGLMIAQQADIREARNLLFQEVGPRVDAANRGEPPPDSWSD